MQMSKSQTRAGDVDSVKHADSLKACKCAECGRVYFPERTICTECGSDQPMLECLVKGPGKLYSYSVVHAAPKSFVAPYAVGYVDFPGNVRVLGQIVGWGNDSLRQGIAMTIERGPIAKEADGSLRESFVFRAIN